MKTLSCLFGLLFAPLVAAQTTVTIPAQTVMAPIAIPAQGTLPAQTIAVPVSIPAQTITIPAPTSSTASGSMPPAVAASAPVTPPASTDASVPGATPPAAAQPAAAPGTYWVYHGGKFRWGGDYSFGSGKVDYSAKDPLTRERVIAITGDEGLQPYATGNDFNTKGYNYIVVSLKPTVEGQNWLTGAEMQGDLPIPGGPGQMQSIMPYGPDPAVVGEWNTYKIPLSVYGIKPGLHILKIAFLQHQQPAPAGQINWYAKDIGFSP